MKSSVTEEADVSVAIQDVVADVIAKRFKLDRRRVVPEASFDELGLDSLSQVELVVMLKHRFGIDITDEELAQISRVSQIVDRLEERGARV